MQNYNIFLHLLRAQREVCRYACKWVTTCKYSHRFLYTNATFISNFFCNCQITRKQYKWFQNSALKMLKKVSRSEYPIKMFNIPTVEYHYLVHLSPPLLLCLVQSISQLLMALNVVFSCPGQQQVIIIILRGGGGRSVELQTSQPDINTWEEQIIKGLTWKHL